MEKPRFLVLMINIFHKRKLVLYSFIDALADYMADDDPIESEKYSAVAKISCNLLYKTIQKQIEINEMNND